MLKLQASPTFNATVEIPLLGGKVAQVACEFRWMHPKALREFMGRLRTAHDLQRPVVRLTQPLLRLLSSLPLVGGWAAKRVITNRSDFDYLNEILVSWEGVDLPWGEDACKRLLEVHPEAVALILGAWAKGLSENRLGN